MEKCGQLSPISLPLEWEMLPGASLTNIGLVSAASPAGWWNDQTIFFSADLKTWTKQPGNPYSPMFTIDEAFDTFWAAETDEDDADYYYEVSQLHK